LNTIVHIGIIHSPGGIICICVGTDGSVPGFILCKYHITTANQHQGKNRLFHKFLFFKVSTNKNDSLNTTLMPTNGYYSSVYKEIFNISSRARRAFEWIIYVVNKNPLRRGDKYVRRLGKKFVFSLDGRLYGFQRNGWLQ
jgi:hypothetical protein